jgi:hypothetical protein
MLDKVRKELLASLADQVSLAASWWVTPPEA